MQSEEPRAKPLKNNLSRTEDTRPEGQTGNYGIRADLSQSAEVDSSPVETATRPQWRSAPQLAFSVKAAYLCFDVYLRHNPGNNAEDRPLVLKIIPGARQHVSRSCTGFQRHHLFNYKLYFQSVHLPRNILVS